MAVVLGGSDREGSGGKGRLQAKTGVGFVFISNLIFVKKWVFATIQSNYNIDSH